MNSRYIKNQLKIKTFRDIKVAYRIKYSNLFVDIVLEKCCHFDVIDLSTCNNNKGLHEKKNQHKRDLGSTL